MKHYIFNIRKKVMIALCIGVIQLAFTGCITLGERWFFYAEKYSDMPLAENEVIKGKEITLKTKDGTILSGLHIKNSLSDDYFLYFYGNMESIKESKERLYYLSARHKINVICFDYRGYGASEGEITFDLLKSDGLAIYDYVKKKHLRKGKLFIFSQSLGTVPCTTIGSQRDVDGIIMEAAFTNAQDAVSHIPDGLVWPLNEVKMQADEKLLNMENQPIELIKKFKAPLLSLHGTKDDLFPFWIGKKMYDAAGSKEKELCALEGIKHNNVNIIEGKAADKIAEFLERYR